MKKLYNWFQTHFKKGTNRLVVIFKNKVIKVPLGINGIKANLLELNNFHQYPNKIAYTEQYFKFFLKQEKLNNIKIFPRYINKNELPIYAQSLYDIKVENRLQIGQSAFGEWKIFDYEDIKFQKNRGVNCA